MNEEEKKVIRQLRDKGFAVAIFTPEEVGDAGERRVEDAMVSAGWDYIDTVS
jgi:hypothetical protein